MHLLVFSSKPGLGVAGVLHPQAEAYPLNRFSAAQLREMIADRHISLAVGAPLTADGVDAFVAEYLPAAEPAAKSTHAPTAKGAKAS